jgi:hypothetical protein
MRSSEGGGNGVLGSVREEGQSVAKEGEGLLAGDYRRHSGLRTISGGINCGGRRWFPRLREQRLLGYQRRIKSFVFRSKPSFFRLVNMSLLDS